MKGRKLAQKRQTSLRLNRLSSLLRFEECRRSKQSGLNSPAWAALPAAAAATGTTTSTSATTPAAAAHNCCEVCLIRQRDGVTLVPCGHARSCATCIDRFVTMSTGCPICRRCRWWRVSITETVATIMNSVAYNWHWLDSVPLFVIGVFWINFLFVWHWRRTCWEIISNLRFFYIHSNVHTMHWSVCV